MIISFAHIEIELLAEKAIWIPSQKLLCLADMHFEKDSYFAKFSTFLPPYGSFETLERLERLIDQLKPDIVIAAGDSFHDKKAALRMPEDLVMRLNKLIKRTPQWHWLSGNHDPALADIILGTRSSEFWIGEIVFRHQSLLNDQFEISGHYHPKMYVTVRKQHLSGPCFVQDGKRLFLPSFGQYTGGLDIDHDAFIEIVAPETRNVFLIHQDKIYRW